MSHTASMVSSDSPRPRRRTFGRGTLGALRGRGAGRVEVDARASKAPGRVTPVAAMMSARTAEARRRRRGSSVVLLLVLLGVTLGALGHVAVHLKSYEVGYELGKERKRRAELDEERRRLELEIGVLKDPGRIMAIAHERLGMGPPAPSDIVPVGELGKREAAHPDPPPASAGRGDKRGPR